MPENQAAPPSGTSRTPPTTIDRRSAQGGSLRVSPATLISIGAIAALVALGVTVQVLPDSDPRTLSMRPWVAARAMGVTAYLLLGIEVALGLVLSHPNNITRWHKTKQVFPWHEMVTVFTGAFIALHVALLAIDPYAKVGVIGALVPGFSEYRPIAVGIGSIALYALIITAVTAKWTRLLPSGWWLKVHRFAVVAFALTWTHAVLAGTDGGALLPIYVLTGVPILAGVGHRWWTARTRPQRPPTPAGASLASIDRPAAAAAEETQ
jgi:DMSO/TMAO reductase YedYZ heme-binding membrane subunit